MVQHVLVPTDGSDLADKAVSQAVAIAKALKAKVTAFHAYPEYRAVALYEYMGPIGEITRKDYLAAAKSTAESYLSRVTKAARAAGLEADGVAVASDYPHEAIIRAAKRRKCDLIIMASHGRRGVSGLLLGSVTQKVLTHSKIPVLVVR
ncbi:MAG: universal stress protein [Burkholderiales bacterium]